MSDLGYETALWYLGRATGVVTLFLLTFVFALGIAVHLGSRPRPVPAFAMTNIHRNAGLLAVVFLVVHVASVVIDPYVTLRWVDAIVPFVGSYRPLWLGLGTFALDLMVAIVVTSLVRVRMGRRAWKAVHYSAYAVLPLTVVHAIGTGTDTKSGLYLALTLACAVGIAAATWWRFSAPDPRGRAPRAARPAAAPVGAGTHRATR